MVQRCLIMEKLGNKFIFRSSLPSTGTALLTHTNAKYEANFHKEARSGQRARLVLFSREAIPVSLLPPQLSGQSESLQNPSSPPQDRAVSRVLRPRLRQGNFEVLCPQGPKINSH